MSSRFKYFTILGSMRSGSNLLEQSLNQFSGITCHGELFNPSFLGKPKAEAFLGLGLSDREKSPKSLIKAMIQDAGEGISGFRMFHDHDPRVAQIALEDPKCAKIILRRDLLDSFISLEIARATDQWMLHDASDRRGQKIRFDAEAFMNYCNEQNRYFKNVNETMQKSGQSAFWVRYPEQRKADVLNGIARFLGHNETRKTFKETIKRQNPESLRDKVDNYEEMQAFIATTDQETRTQTYPFETSRRANIPKMVSCKNAPILFAPIPGGPNEEVLRWMQTVDGGSGRIVNYGKAVSNGSILHTGHNQRTLFEWMESNPDVATLTAVRHPIPRAYEVFMSKIFSVGPETYDVIREYLVNYYGVAVPEADVMENASREALSSQGYGIGQHRAAFHAFLRFLKNNLAGQTSLRVDGLWNSQMTFLSGFNTAIPISIILKEGNMDAGFRYFESTLDIAKPELGARIQSEHMFSLDEIYTRQTENLARKAYSMDYVRFGFDDFQAALDA